MAVVSYHWQSVPVRSESGHVQDGNAIKKAAQLCGFFSLHPVHDNV